MVTTNDESPVPGTIGPFQAEIAKIRSAGAPAESTAITPASYEAADHEADRLGPLDSQHGVFSGLSCLNIAKRDVRSQDKIGG